MALIETVLEEIFPAEPAGAVAIGLVALAAPALVPGLRPRLRPLLKSAAKLFVEAEFEADGGIIESLADAVIDELFDAAAQGAADETQRRIEHRVRRYARRAHGRAARMGRDDADRQARYRRHIETLGRRLAVHRYQRDGRARKALDQAAALLRHL